MKFQNKDIINDPTIHKFLKLIGLVRRIPASKLDKAIETLEEIIEGEQT
jgi:hypothetical protein